MVTDTLETTYTDARRHFASLWDRLASTRETLIVHRRGAEDMAMLPVAELSALMETAHLLRSPENARRLLSALSRAWEGRGKAEPADGLSKRMGLDDA